MFSVNESVSKVKISDSPNPASAVLAESSRGAPRLPWRSRMRPDDDDENAQDWWFASTAIPLLAATTGPLANMLSIAALVTPWRGTLPDGGAGQDDQLVLFPDPRWLVMMFPPFAASTTMLIVDLIAITAAMDKHDPPIRPEESYSQGFWHAIIAAILYLISSAILLINMLGYFLGHYPQHFTLTEHQRTLILQTMIFFIWLAGGAAVFSRVCDWSFADALYFCDVTVLTVGFGDFAPPNNAARGLVIPFSVGGIITLGLIVNSIRRFTIELSREKVIKPHVEKQRILTLGRSVTSEKEIKERGGDIKHTEQPTHSVKVPLKDRKVSFSSTAKRQKHGTHAVFSDPEHPQTGITRSFTTGGGQLIRKVVSSKPGVPRLLLLREEKDRFNAMRDIEKDAHFFKRWFALSMSFLAYSVLWCLGALVFYFAEDREQGMSYFQALYFCYVSLLTIGYGDLSPKSNAGKPFFIIWSLVAVPVVTILISDMSDTVVASFKRGTFTLADWTVLPKKGLYRDFLERYPWILSWIQRKAQEKAKAKRIEEGFPIHEPDDPMRPTLEDLASGEPDEHDLARKLALAIRRTAQDMRYDPPKRYSYEEWAEFTRLIRFSSATPAEVKREEDEEGIIEWDWIGENSPLLAEETESEWILDRLCESLSRYIRQHVVAAGRKGSILMRKGREIAFEERAKRKARRNSEARQSMDNDPGDISPLQESGPFWRRESIFRERRETPDEIAERTSKGNILP
ncbi:MAG: Potassium channel [Trizodia sp. TS-e1964]|nr:MAG: Potassium channel [Trizodia sp. TS-e1964]